MAFFASAKGAKPAAVMGNVTYSAIGTNQLEGGPASLYGNFLEGNLINSGGVSILAQGEALETVNLLREEFNQLNGGRGASVQKTDAQGNKFWGYEKLDPSKALSPQYRIDANISVTRARHSENPALQDVSVAVRIYDIKTGQMVSQTTEVRRNVDPYANLVEIGPKPTWWQRNIAGYVREIKYDDPVREAIGKASKTIVDKFSELSGQKAESDADRFARTLEESGYKPIVPDEIRNPRNESGNKSEGKVPVPGTPISKSNYDHILGTANCPQWAVLQETGVYCFTKEGMDSLFGGGRGLGIIHSIPPTYPFYDGKEPWLAPEKSPAEASADEIPDSSVSDSEKEYRQWLDCIGRPVPKTRVELEERERQDAVPGSPCYNPNPPDIKKAPDGTRLPDVLWTVPR